MGPNPKATRSKKKVLPVTESVVNAFGGEIAPLAIFVEEIEHALRRNPKNPSANRR